MSMNPDPAAQARCWLNQALVGLDVRFNPDRVAAGDALALAGVYAQLAALDRAAAPSTTTPAAPAPDALRAMGREVRECAALLNAALNGGDGQHLALVATKVAARLDNAAYAYGGATATGRDRAPHSSTDRL